MSAYARQLRALSDAIIDRKEQPMLPLIKPARSDEISPTTRLAVYADGYLDRLIKTTTADYPALQHYFGAKAFNDAVRAYVSATDSKHWDLNLYPISFATFLKQYSENKAAQALATVESVIIELFWLPESPAADSTRLSMLSFEQLAEHRFLFRTASSLLALDYAANTYLNGFRSGIPPDAMEQKPEYLAIVRHNNEVHRHELETMEYALLAELNAGKTFGEALDKLAEDSATDQSMLASRLPDYIARWLRWGLFT